jgi:Tol biopolymer transport system component
MDGGSRMFITDLTGSEPVRVTSATEGVELNPDWEPALTTPDISGQIAFASDREGNSELYIMNADGTQQSRLAERPNFSDGDISWSHDGQMIAFASHPLPSYPIDIYSMRADGSGQTRLVHTTTTIAENLNPTWSPDGSRIAFVSTRDGGGAEIYVMLADGSEQTRLTFSTTRETEWNLHPAWSPDGRQIAYRSTQAGNQEIFVMNVDGTDQRNLTNNPTADAQPAWSPDGRQIAFVRFRDGANRIWVMNADGTGQTQITDGPGTIDLLPTWSPDGQYIAFTSNRDAVAGGALHYDIYVIRSNGSGATYRLTHEFGVASGPAWRPDNSATSTNHAPVADAGPDISTFRSSATTANVSLDGTHSSDPDGDALEFTWFEGAAPIATGATASVELPLGVHTITLQVSDGRGGTSSDEVVVTVGNRAPELNTGGPYTGLEGTAVSLAATATDADGDALTYEWSFGDGSSGSGSALPLSHVFEDNGSYHATFSANDGHGGSTVSSTTINIGNVAPTVRVGAGAQIVSGASFNFSGSFSDPGIHDSPWNWTLNWGEGPAVSGTNLSPALPIAGVHQYLRVGTYRVELTVTDHDGSVGMGSLFVDVGRLPVIVDAVPFSGTQPRTVVYNVKKPALSEPVVLTVFGTSSFAPVDALTKRAAINLSTVRLGGVPIATLPFAPAGAPNGAYVVGAVDVNGDGRLDLIMTFQTDRLVQAGALNPTLTTLQTLILLGDHVDGRQFTASQQIRVVTLR